VHAPLKAGPGEDGELAGRTRWTLTEPRVTTPTFVRTPPWAGYRRFGVQTFYRRRHLPIFRQLFRMNTHTLTHLVRVAQVHQVDLVMLWRWRDGTPRDAPPLQRRRRLPVAVVVVVQEDALVVTCNFGRV